MEIKLSPELEAVVAGDMALGRFGSVEEYVAEAVGSLHERLEWSGETLEEERATLEGAWQEAERGELLSVGEVRAEMQEMKAAWLGQRKSA